MALVRPFCALRPKAELAAQTAALPYDVYSREEARLEAGRNPLSFLNIDRAETQFPEDTDPYDPKVYKKAGELLRKQEEQGIYSQDPIPHFYLYELTRKGKSQTGICACTSVEEYWKGIVVKHENTREDKEQDRIRHVNSCQAQTGPVFLAHRRNRELAELKKRIRETPPLYDFTGEDQIRHRVWSFPAEENDRIREMFQKIGKLYIADGHHRAAAAAQVCREKREEDPAFTGDEEWNYFLAVIFDEEELQILDYNRAVRGLKGRTETEFLEEMKKRTELIPCSREEARPGKKGEAGMYLRGQWYRFALACEEDWDPVKRLDVSLLQDQILFPVLGIEDPRRDKRIDFIGGIRGMKELERRGNTDCDVAFCLYPTAMGELFDVADAGLLMPPKSTWFEPKLRSGLLIHKLQ